MNSKLNTEVRTQIDDLLATLKSELARPGQSLIPLLTTMSRFSRYSLANQMLIYAPMRLRAPDSGNDAADDLAAASRLSFRVAYVFDISQVDAQPGAAVDRPGTDTSAFTTHFADSRTAELAIHRLHAFLVGHNVELEYKHLAQGLMGYTDGRRITCALGQPDSLEFATLVHETTHLLLHFPADRTTRPDLITRETEAEAVAYLHCAQLGIAGTEASIDYIKSYRGTPDTLDASLERIRTTALRLATELDAVQAWETNA